MKIISKAIKILIPMAVLMVIGYFVIHKVIEIQAKKKALMSAPSIAFEMRKELGKACVTLFGGETGTDLGYPLSNIKIETVVHVDLDKEGYISSIEVQPDAFFYGFAVGYRGKMGGTALRILLATMCSMTIWDYYVENQLSFRSQGRVVLDFHSDGSYTTSIDSAANAFGRYYKESKLTREQTRQALVEDVTAMRYAMQFWNIPKIDRDRMMKD
jgi:hypothetical protein